jgi:hypothetical protein
VFFEEIDMRMRTISAGLPLLLGFTLVGCTPAGPGGGTVTGNVTMGGRPLPGGMVTFHGPENKTAVATIDPEGKYNGTGVPIGSNKVTVQGPPPSPGGVKDPVSGTGGVSIAVPPRYADPNQSGLSVEVKLGKQTFPIDLK